ncbi:Speckle-type POZ protein B [Araneus ventricosus]|uniref:Speckle-type POZ protein B n=1 Tax=Araneus ventricosus TaxID=182803 RepID=A0A4Y2C4C7_ARAVE|nr:Speckle-type POZ protein B [Araneus ventricosus]
MSEEVETRKTFTFFWIIENLDLFFKKKHISSPFFQVDSSERTFWYLSFWTENMRGFTEICVWCMPVDGDEDESDGSRVEFELSLLKPDGLPLKTSKGNLTKGFSCSPWLQKEEFECFRNAFFPDNSFTIRCKMWKTGLGFESSNFCIGRTTLTKEKDTIFWSVRRFSSLNSGGKRSRCVKLNLQSFPSVTLNLLLRERNDEIEIEIINNYSRIDFKTFWRVSVLDIFGERVNSWHIWWDMTEKRTSNSFPCFMTLSELMANKELYLPNDTLILQFDCEITQRRQMTVGIQRTDNLESDDPELNSKELSHLNIRSENLSMDLANLYKEGLFSDVILQVGSETFPVHKAILGARSPVFKAMFTLDMKEKKETCIELKEIEGDTLHRLLLYMYTDTIEDLQYETAAALYAAADRYDLTGLRKKCSAVLKTKLSIVNTCELLVLADMHSDEDLKRHVASYFIEHSSEIALLDDGECFLKNHFSLALEITRNVIRQTR